MRSSAWVAYHTPDRESSDYLRPHAAKNADQHEEFLKAYALTPEDYAEVIDWFRTRPLWLDLGGLRVVHACLEMRLIDKIEASTGGSTPSENNFLPVSLLSGCYTDRNPIT